MLHISWLYSRVQLSVDDVVKSMDELKEEGYCLSYDNFKDLLNQISTIKDKEVRAVLEWKVRKIYAFTFQGASKMQPIPEHPFYIKNKKDRKL